MKHYIKPLRKEAKRAFENYYKLAHVVAKLKSFTSAGNWLNNKHINTYTHKSR
jgi:hypothetical protein